MSKVKAPDALLNGKLISVGDALKDPDKDYRCVVCAMPVKPFNKGVNRKTGQVHPEHFEHRERNPNCERSDPLR